MQKVIAAGIALPMLLLIYQAWPLVEVFLSWLVFLCTVLCGVVFGVALHLWKGKVYVPPIKERVPSPANELFTKLAERKTDLGQQRVVLSRNLDLAFKEVLDLVLQDFVLSWYKDLVKNDQGFVDLLRHDFWIVLEKFSASCQNLDLVQLVTQDTVNVLRQHFQKIEAATRRTKTSEPAYEFELHGYLRSEDHEMQFLRRVADFILLKMLPAEYANVGPVARLLQEILTCKVLKPTIESMCDPDYINQTLLGYIEYRLRLSEEHRRTYLYAASYEKFYKLILESNDIEHLKQMRLSIITEIMQSTTINNIKRAEGLAEDKASTPKGSSKGDLLKSRNLRRYINQLTLAKTKCEQRIILLGGQEYSGYGETDQQDKQYIPGRKVLSFALIMGSPEARKSFQKFLLKDDNDSLIRFWSAVEQLRSVERNQRHQLASEIYQMFIGSPSSVVKVDKACVKDMESFMIGDKGPEAFFKAQSQVYTFLEKKQYPSFIVSDIYHAYISNLELEEFDQQGTASSSFHTQSDAYEDINMSEVDGYENPNYVIARHSTYAHQKLNSLDQKIQDKTHALDALKSSQKSGDEKIQKVQKDVQDEIEKLKFERRHLEFHIDRTDVWSENIGKWQTRVCSSEVTQEENKLVPYFVILVHLSGSALHKPEKSGTHGWIVTRSLPDFHALHTKLVLICPWLRKKEIPSVSKFSFKSVDSVFLEKAKTSLEQYLQTVLKDERLTQSEALYAFLSPSPEYLKQPPGQEDKKTFSLRNFFKNLPGTQEQKAEEELLFFDEESKEETTRDDIAEPLYALIGEVFHLKKVTRLLRRSLVVFVQVTFGRSINRQVRETVEWMFSEPMIIYYLHLFRDSFWPNGELAPTAPSRSDEEKMQTRMQAKRGFLENVPDAIKNLLGEKNTRTGAIQIFEAFQDKRLNKHLFYCMLDLLLQQMFSELRSTDLTEELPARPAGALIRQFSQELSRQASLESTVPNDTPVESDESRERFTLLAHNLKYV